MSWIKINKKQSNLPTEEQDGCWCWLRIHQDDCIDKEYTVIGQWNGKGNFFNSRTMGTITHYWIIDEPNFLNAL